MVLEEEVVPKVEEVYLVDGVFDGTFGGDGEEDVAMGEGVVETSSSLEILTKSCWNEYLRKGRKTKPKRQNRTRNGKAKSTQVKEMVSSKKSTVKVKADNEEYLI
ncbi:hypothetical protein Tco_1145308, partial [Tanacetum coccineum]